MDDDKTKKEETQSTEQNQEMNVLFDVQNAINSNLKKVNNLKEDMKPHKEMLDSIFTNDEDYVKKSNEAKKASKDKSEAKKRILSQPQAAELDQKINDIKLEMKDAQEALSYYLREYQRLTGSNEFESEDGELREIVFVAKLIRPTS